MSRCDPITAELSAAELGPIAPRQCGRCRLIFPGESGADLAATPAWWVCPPCRVALFGREQDRHQASRWALTALKDAAVPAGAADRTAG